MAKADTVTASTVARLSGMTYTPVVKSAKATVTAHIAPGRRSTDSTVTGSLGTLTARQPA